MAAEGQERAPGYPRGLRTSPGVTRARAGPGAKVGNTGALQHKGLGGSTKMALRGQRRGLCEKR